MKCKSLCLAVLLAAFAGTALAQTPISGTSKCGKPDASQPTEVGDQAGHTLVTEKGSCTWSVPLEMAGLKSTTYTVAEAVDANGAKFQVRGYAVMMMDNGDKAYVRYQGTGTGTQEGSTGEGTWSYTGGTGKLKGLKGKGTFKTSQPSSEAGPETKVEGEYSLPEPGATAKKK